MTLEQAAERSFTQACLARERRDAQAGSALLQTRDRFGDARVKPSRFRTRFDETKKAGEALLRRDFRARKLKLRKRGPVRRQGLGADADEGAQAGPEAQAGKAHLAFERPPRERPQGAADEDPIERLVRDNDDVDAGVGRRMDLMPMRRIDPPEPR